MRYTDAIKVKASLLDDGVVDTLGLVGAMSGVRVLTGCRLTSLQVRVEPHALCHTSQHTRQIIVAMWVNSRQFLESACPRCITILSLSELVWMT
jgi:hypothetical protein